MNFVEAMTILEQLMEENKNVLMRLKDEEWRFTEEEKVRLS